MLRGRRFLVELFNCMLDIEAGASVEDRVLRFCLLSVVLAPEYRELFVLRIRSHYRIT